MPRQAHASSPETIVQDNALSEATDRPRPAFQVVQRAVGTDGIDLDVWKMGVADVVEMQSPVAKEYGPTVEVTRWTSAIEGMLPDGRADVTGACG